MYRHTDRLFLAVMFREASPEVENRNAIYA